MNASASRRWAPRLIVSALACLVGAWLPFAAAVDDRGDQALEIDLAADTGGRLQAFYDRGRGIVEADSSVAAFAASATPVRLRLPLPAGTHRVLRIDPNDRPGRYTITGIRIVVEGNREAASVPLDEIRAAAQATVQRDDAGGLLVLVAAGSTDPQLLYEPRIPIVLAPPRLQVGRIAGYGVAAGVLTLLLAILLDRSRAATRLASTVISHAAVRPAATIVVVGLAATLLATYPLLLGRSLVSPGNGPVNLLYDQAPYTYGATDLGYEDARGADVGAMMWAILPYTVVQREALARGEWPLWNRYNTTGEPLWGQGQTFILDPFHLASLAIPDAAVAMDTRFVVARAVFAVGAGLAAFGVTAHLPAAVLVAAAAPFIGHFTARLNHPAYFSIVYVPWILLAYARLSRSDARRARYRAAGLIGLATFVQMAGSTPKEGLIALAAAHAAGLIGLLLTSRRWSERLAQVDAAAIGCAAAILATAPHWLVFLGTLGRSYTLYDQPGAVFASEAETVAYAFGSVAPGQPQTGVVPLLMVAAGCALAWPRRLARSGVGAGAALTTLLCAAIAYGAVPAAFLMRLPLIGNIHHIGGSFLSATVTPLLVVAAVGLAAAWDAVRDGATIRVTTIAAIGVLLLALLLPGDPLGATATLGAAVIVVTALALAAFATAAVAPAPSAILAVAATLVASVIAGGLHLETGILPIDALVIQPRQRADLERRSPAFGALPRGGDPYRVAPIDAVMFPGTQAYWGIEAIGGPDALRLPAIEPLSDAVGIERSPWGWLTILKAEQSPAVAGYLDMLNVRYLVARPGQVPPGLHPLAVAGDDLVRVIERPTAWPRAFFVGGVERHAGVRGLAARLATADGPFVSVDQQDSSSVESVGDLPNSGVVIPATDYRLTPNSTSLRVATNTAGVIAVSEAFVDADFTATLNGAPVPYFRANHALRAVRVPGAGDWELRFVYRPARWSAAWALGAIGLAVLACLILATPLLKKSSGGS